MQSPHLKWRPVGPGMLMVAGALAAAPSSLADTSPPTIKVLAPVAGAVFDQQLRLEASATDPDGLGRITFQADGKPIRSFTSHLANGVAVGLDWRHARELSLGEHTITVIAVDHKGSNPITSRENTAVVTIKVRRVDATALPKARTGITIALHGTGVDRTVTGSVTAVKKSAPGSAFPLDGKVRVTWQIYSNGRFKTRHKDSDANIAAYEFRQHLAGKGRWRVRVSYDPEPPYQAAITRTIAFTAR